MQPRSNRPRNEASGYLVQVHHDGAQALAHAPAFGPDDSVYGASAPP